MGFLSSLFQRKPKTAWVELALDLKGEYLRGSLWRYDAIEARVGGWRIRLDQKLIGAGQSFALMTYVRAPVILAEDFGFKVSERGLLAQLSRWLGVKIIETDDAELDAKLAIQSKDEERARALFTDPAVVYLLKKTEVSELELRRARNGDITNPPAEAYHILVHEHSGDIDNLQHLKMLFLLEAEILNRLRELGLADSP